MEMRKTGRFVLVLRALAPTAYAQETRPAALREKIDAAVKQARDIYAALQEGRIDRALFTANASAYFSLQALADFAAIE